VSVVGARLQPSGRQHASFLVDRDDVSSVAQSTAEQLMRRLYEPPPGQRVAALSASNVCQMVAIAQD
jgi:hypothetical protein